MQLRQERDLILINLEKTQPQFLPSPLLPLFQTEETDQGAPPGILEGKRVRRGEELKDEVFEEDLLSASDLQLRGARISGDKMDRDPSFVRGLHDFLL